MKTRKREDGKASQLLLGLFAAAVFVAIPLAAIFAADITPGYTFSSGEANVTHTKLNNSAAGTINSTFYSGKSSAGANPTPGSYTFIGLDAISGNYQRATLDVWVFDHTALLEARTLKAVPVGGDKLLIGDSGAGGAYKSQYVSNTLFGATAVTSPTNTDVVPVLHNGAQGAITLSNLFNWAVPLAVQAASTNYQYIIGSGAWKDVTNLTVTITPRSPLSRFLLRTCLNGNIETTAAHFRFLRDSTAIGLGENLGGLRPLASKTIGDADTQEITMEWIDAPATASAITYKVQVLQENAVGALHLNRGNSATDSTNNASGVSTFIVQEVRQ